MRIHLSAILPFVLQILLLRSTLAAGKLNSGKSSRIGIAVVPEGNTSRRLTHLANHLIASPRVLTVTAPFGPITYEGFDGAAVSCEGMYNLVTTRLVNNRSLWKHAIADRWIYMMISGRWGIGGKNEELKGFMTDLAYVYCDRLAGIRLPNEEDCNGNLISWQRWTGSVWTEDASITILSQEDPSPAPPVLPQPPLAAVRPAVIFVNAPRGPIGCAGTYRVDVSQTANSMPVYKHLSENRWMYRMSNGRWGIGGNGAQANFFRGDSAYIFCDADAGGRYPHEIVCMWQRWDQAQWWLDPDIHVRSIDGQVFNEPGISVLTTPANTGNRTLSIFNTTGFLVGREVLIDGQAQGEVHMVIEIIYGMWPLGILITQTPFRYSHEPGTKVNMLIQANISLDLVAFQDRSCTTQMLLPNQFMRGPFQGVGDIPYCYRWLPDVNVRNFGQQLFASFSISCAPQGQKVDISVFSTNGNCNGFMLGMMFEGLPWTTALDLFSGLCVDGQSASVGRIMMGQDMVDINGAPIRAGGIRLTTLPMPIDSFPRCGPIPPGWNMTQTNQMANQSILQALLQAMVATSSATRRALSLVTGVVFMHVALCSVESC